MLADSSAGMLPVIVLQPFVGKLLPFVGGSARATKRTGKVACKGDSMKTMRISVIAVLMLTGGLVLAQQRFDDLVRGDFFAGVSGNKEALDRGMKKTEEILANEPNHAEAKVWHGSGLMTRSGEAFQKGDFQNGMSLWQQALKEMEQAVQLDPTNVGVLIPRGAVLITASRFTPPEMGKPILEVGVADFEKVLKLQEAYFSSLGTHPRGELLTGIAEGWSRLGNQDKARQYFERIASELSGSVYEQKARAWLENKPEVKSPAFFNCSGCHVR
jgi:tetratricopeptide (TPR) repeat protein